MKQKHFLHYSILVLCLSLFSSLSMSEDNQSPPTPNSAVTVIPKQKTGLAALDAACAEPLKAPGAIQLEEQRKILESRMSAEDWAQIEGLASTLIIDIKNPESIRNFATSSLEKVGQTAHTLLEEIKVEQSTDNGAAVQGFMQLEKRYAGDRLEAESAGPVKWWKNPIKWAFNKKRTHDVGEMSVNQAFEEYKGFIITKISESSERIKISGLRLTEAEALIKDNDIHLAAAIIKLIDFENTVVPQVLEDYRNQKIARYELGQWQDLARQFQRKVQELYNTHFELQQHLFIVTDQGKVAEQQRAQLSDIVNHSIPGIHRREASAAIARQEKTTAELIHEHHEAANAIYLEAAQLISDVSIMTALNAERQSLDAKTIQKVEEIFLNMEKSKAKIAEEAQAQRDKDRRDLMTGLGKLADITEKSVEKIVINSPKTNLLLSDMANPDFGGIIQKQPEMIEAPAADAVPVPKKTSP